MEIVAILRVRALKFPPLDRKRRLTGQPTGISLRRAVVGKKRRCRCQSAHFELRKERVLALVACPPRADCPWFTGGTPQAFNGFQPPRRRLDPRLHPASAGVRETLPLSLEHASAWLLLWASAISRPLAEARLKPALRRGNGCLAPRLKPGANPAHAEARLIRI